MLSRSLGRHELVFKQWFLAVAMVITVSQATCGPEMVCGEILERPRASQTIPSGSGFTIHCTTSLSEIPVEWTCFGKCSALQPDRDHAYIVMSDEVQTAYSDRVSLETGRSGQRDLHFKVATESDSGNYTCKDNAGIGDQASGMVIVSTKSTDDVPMKSRRPPELPGVTSAPNRFKTSAYVDKEEDGSKRTVSRTGGTAIIIVSVLLSVVVVGIIVGAILYRRFRNATPNPHPATSEVDGVRDGNGNGDESISTNLLVDQNEKQNNERGSRTIETVVENDSKRTRVVFV